MSRLIVYGTDFLKNSGRPNYTITVSGSAAVAGSGDNEGDSVSGNTIAGQIGGSRDTYEIEGQVTSMDVPDEATVKVDGRTITEDDVAGGVNDQTPSSEPEPEPTNTNEPVNTTTPNQTGGATAGGGGGSGGSGIMAMDTTVLALVALAGAAGVVLWTTQ